MKASFVAFAALLLTLGLHLQSCQGKREDCKAASECLQRLKPMIEDLLKMSKSLNTKDDIKHKKLLPKMKKKQGVYGLKQMLDFYQEDVFKKHSPDSKTEEDIMNNLSRLRVDVGGCLNHPSCKYSPKEDAMIKRMRTTFVELKEKGVHKAFGELPRMLDWINDYVH
ncbi:interleukin-26-like [Acipenser oxyrinchus oxyrinchus]|uniref:Interleukin family protein n=1 Tax=Acipenser oxyrinchus oxyrinchus TaxID=40147 RepID=A0AAD8DIJ6_ACIOX|nr:interleukin-26-like [Acipenser oxyrinchus oxyrinchus]